MRRRAPESAPLARPPHPIKASQRRRAPRTRSSLQFPAPPLKIPTTVGVFVFCVCRWPRISPHRFLPRADGLWAGLHEHTGAASSVFRRDEVVARRIAGRCHFDTVGMRSSLLRVRPSVTGLCSRAVAWVTAPRSSLVLSSAERAPDAAAEPDVAGVVVEAWAPGLRDGDLRRGTGDREPG